jgi:hypothetical protein
MKLELNLSFSKVLSLSLKVHCITAALHHSSTASQNHYIIATLHKSNCITVLHHNSTASQHCITALHHSNVSQQCITAAKHRISNASQQQCITAALHHSSSASQQH